MANVNIIEVNGTMYPVEDLQSQQAVAAMQTEVTAATDKANESSEKAESAKTTAGAAEDAANDALEAAQAAKEATDTLSSELEDTIKTTVAPMLETRTVLWTNPNLASGMEPQSLSIPNMGEYDRLEILFSSSAAGKPNAEILAVDMTGQGNVQIKMGGVQTIQPNAVFSIISRNITIWTNLNQINIETGYTLTKNFNNEYTVQESNLIYCIVEVVGIKYSTV